MLRKRSGADVGFRAAIRKNPAEGQRTGRRTSDWLAEHDLPPAGVHLLELALRAKEFSDGSQEPQAEARLREGNRAPPGASVEARGELAGRAVHVVQPEEPTRSSSSSTTGGRPPIRTLAAGILSVLVRWDVLT